MADEDKKDTAASTEVKKEAAKKEADKEAIEKIEEVKETVSEAINEATEGLDNLSEEAKKIIEQVEKMTVLELNELVKVLEKKFGVSAQAVATAPAAGAGGDEVPEEQDSFSVELKESGDQKIAVIKIVKEVLGLGLKDAKDIVDGAPTTLKEDVKKEEAEEIKKKIEGAGGKIELK